MPLRDYICTACDIKYTDVLVGAEERIVCLTCNSGEHIQLTFSFPANYTIKGDNSGSTKPKRMGGNKE